MSASEPPLAECRSWGSLHSHPNTITQTFWVRIHRGRAEEPEFTQRLGSASPGIAELGLQASDLSQKSMVLGPIMNLNFFNTAGHSLLFFLGRGRRLFSKFDDKYNPFLRTCSLLP